MLTSVANQEAEIDKQKEANTWDGPDDYEAGVGDISIESNQSIDSRGMSCLE